MLHPTSGVSLFKTILRVKIGRNANVCLNDGNHLSPSPSWHLNAFVLHVFLLLVESLLFFRSHSCTQTFFFPITQLTHTCFAFKSHLLHWSHSSFRTITHQHDIKGTWNTPTNTAEQQLCSLRGGGLLLIGKKTKTKQKQLQSISLVSLLCHCGDLLV